MLVFVNLKINPTLKKLDNLVRYGMLLQNWTKYIGTWCILYFKRNFKSKRCREAWPVCKLCCASDVRRACAAQCHPAHVAAGMRAGALRPSGSVWLATPRRGRSRLPGRRFVPASDVAHARTHWRAACKWGGAASSLPLCPRAASSFPGSRGPAFGGRRAVGVSPYADRYCRV